MNASSSMSSRVTHRLCTHQYLYYFRAARISCFPCFGRRHTAETNTTKLRPRLLGPAYFQSSHATTGRHHPLQSSHQLRLHHHTSHRHVGLHSPVYYSTTTAALPGGPSGSAGVHYAHVLFDGWRVTQASFAPKGDVVRPPVRSGTTNT